MERLQGRQERELEEVRQELVEAQALIRKMGRIIQSRDTEIKELREHIAKKERRRILPAMPEGKA